MCAGPQGGWLESGGGGKAEIPRNAFSFFKSAIFCPNKGQEHAPVCSPQGPAKA